MSTEQRRLEVTMEELFTREELDKARKIFNKYKAKPRYFREQILGREVVKPRIKQINAYTGYKNLPEYWAYCLEHYLRSVSIITQQQNRTLAEPEDDMKHYKITELFTTDEINRAMKLFIECKNTKEHFNVRCAREVVQPIISRVNANDEYDNSPASLSYRLEIYLKYVRGEEDAKHHRYMLRSSGQL
jgi:hypothetical protein